MDLSIRRAAWLHLLLPGRARHRKIFGQDGTLAVGGVPYSKGDMAARATTLGYSAEPVPDLPGSRDEALAVGGLFPRQQNEILIDGRATETAFKTASNSHPFRFIHIAVHAFSSDEPDRAALMMLRDPHGSDDGFLQASEIVQMHMSAKLVVLSACDTGVGPIQGEEGISTLSNAFIVAGAQTVVSTLWPVEDAPSQFLIKHFYENMANQDDDPSNALTDAKREMLRVFGDRNLPIYWAGFILEGRTLAHIKS